MKRQDIQDRIKRDRWRFFLLVPRCLITDPSIVDLFYIQVITNCGLQV